MARRVSSLRLLGREQERLPLWAALERTRAGDPSLAVVLGEAGIGKSRLVRDLQDRARAAGVLTLSGDCLQLDGGEVPYAPIAAALRGLPAAMVGDLRAALPRRAWTELVRAFPALSGGDDELDASAAADRFSQARLFEFLLALLRRVSHAAPVLIVVEDIHWIDASTRDVIRFLVHNLSTERVAIVLTYRDDEVPTDHPVPRFLAELLRSNRVESVCLGALSADAIAEQVREIVGDEAVPGLVEEIYARCGGNPFLAEELLAARDAGEQQGEVPSTLRDALLLRLGRLGAAGLPVLRGAAALRRPASSGLLAAVAGADDRTVSAVLRAAIQHHILVKLPAETFGFRHDLVRQVIYDDLLPAERLDVHARIAEGLAAEDSDAAFAEMAFHWRIAGRAPEALVASIRAALAAEAASAFAEARGHLEHVLELWGRADGVPLPLDRQEVIEHAARLARYCGDYPRAIELCDTALEELDGAADPVRAARMHELRGRCESFDEQCGLASFRRALDVLPAGHRAERARLLGAEGFALIGLHRWTEARDRCAAAVALAEEAGADEPLAYARARLGLALGFTGDGAAGEEQLLAAREIAERLGLAEDLLYADLYLGEVRRLRGRLEAAHAAMVDGERAGRSLGMEASFGRFMGLNAAADLLMLGRWDEAQARIAATDGLALEPWEVLLRLQVAGQLAVMRGDMEAAARHLDEARSLCDDGAPADYLPGVFAALAERALWTGRPADAGATVDEALERLSGTVDPLNTPVLFSLGTRACADVAERSRIVGADAQAKRARERAAALLAELDLLLGDFGGCALAPAHRALCKAELARAEGQPDAALWHAACAAWRELDVPYVAAYAQWRVAEALLLGGAGRKEAEPVLAEAWETALRLGADPLRGEVEDLAHRARLRLQEPAPEAARPDDDEPPLGLTRRELEVLELIAEGLTNRQIAERLFISEKTAGVHVSHILSKLNVHNRLTAAGVAHQLGLSRPRPEP